MQNMLEKRILAGVLALSVFSAGSTIFLPSAEAAEPSLMEQYQEAQRAHEAMDGGYNTDASHPTSEMKSGGVEMEDTGALTFAERIHNIIEDYYQNHPSRALRGYEKFQDIDASSYDMAPEKETKGEAKPSAVPEKKAGEAKAPEAAKPVQPAPVPPKSLGTQKKYNFDWRGTPLAQSLYGVAKVAGKGIVINAETKGTVYVSLKQVTCEQALDYLSRAFDFNWMTDGDNIIIGTDSIMPQSKVFHIGYVNKDNLVKDLTAIGIASGSINANPETGTITVSGTPYELAMAERRIKDLDQPVAQVLLIAQFIDLSHGKDVDLGMSYTLPAYDHAADDDLHGNFLQKLTFASSATANRALNKGKVISRPMVLARNGQEAKVVFGDRVPIMNSTSTTSSTNITVTYETVGTQLTMTPSINEKTGDISLDIQGSVSQITSWQSNGGGTRAPQISTRDITTSTHVKSGQSFVIGGLMNEQDMDNLAGIPGLMNLPILGKLFSIHNKSKQYDEVFVMITPYIVTDDLDPQALLKQGK